MVKWRLLAREGQDLLSPPDEQCLFGVCSLKLCSLSVLQILEKAAEILKANDCVPLVSSYTMKIIM